MNKQKLIIISIFTIVAISLGATASLNSSDGDYVYVQSDITKANPNITVAPTHVSLLTDEISEIKHTVVLTIKGTVLSVDNPVNWTDESNHPLGFVPVTIELDKKTKDKTTHLKLKNGDHFTVYLGGVYLSDKFYMHGHEPQFEIGEKVLLHVGHDKNGPNFVDDGLYFVKLGEYGKYKVVSDKAYNDKYKKGKSLDEAFNEAN